MGGLDHLPERVCCRALSGGNSSSENVKGGARNTAGGGAGSFFFSWSPDDGIAEGREGGGESEGSDPTKAGFRRSMEMTYGWSTWCPEGIGTNSLILRKKDGRHGESPTGTSEPTPGISCSGRRRDSPHRSSAGVCQDLPSRLTVIPAER